MTRTRTTVSLAGAVLVGGAVMLAAAEGTKPREDDLSLVKRAVAQNTPAETAAAPRTASAGREPQWLKVRIVDKLTGKKKVTVNMPISLVKALGDDMPIDWPCGDHEADHRARSTVKLSAVLQALEAGQDLVEVDDEESQVRVWVE